MSPILILTWALGQLGFSGQPLLVADAVDGPAWVRYKSSGSARWDTLDWFRVRSCAWNLSFLRALRRATA